MARPRLRFELRLSAYLGMTRSEMLQRMDAEELAYRELFSEIEPFGEERMDLRFASLEALLLNFFRKEDTDLIQPLDILPDWGGFLARAKEAKKADSWEKARLIMKAYAKRQKMARELREAMKAEREKRRASHANRKSGGQDISRYGRNDQRSEQGPG